MALRVKVGPQMGLNDFLKNRKGEARQIYKHSNVDSCLFKSLFHGSWLGLLRSLSLMVCGLKWFISIKLCVFHPRARVTAPPPLKKPPPPLHTCIRTIHFLDNDIIGEELKSFWIGWIICSIFQLFDTLDVSHTGSLTPEDLHEGLKRIDSEVTWEEVDSVLKRLDQNGDGVINFDDFLFHMTQGGLPDGGDYVNVKQILRTQEKCTRKTLKPWR